MKRRWLKGIFLFVLIFSAFHLSGMESAFCDDGAAAATDMHGCSVCHPGGHSVVLHSALETHAEIPMSFSFVEYNAIKIQEPSFSFFRPPIPA